jgi:DNA-binding transcriptional ArsR family regulator
MGLARRRLGTIDLDTGEISDDLLIASPKKRRLDGEFVMATQDGFLRLARDPDLTGEDFKVLMIYLANLDFENFLQISQSYIATDLGMKKENVSRATKRLVEKGILIKGLKVGRHQTYRLNAFYGWKGKADKKYWDECEKHAKAQ